jgi:hypothetical protein
MFLTPERLSPAARLARHDSVFLLVLAMTLLLATSTFFGPFAMPAILVGALLSFVLHRWTADPSSGFAVTDRLTPINFASVHVGGDAGGLIFVLGSVAILGMGLPTLRWFLIGSVIVAVAVAIARITWMSVYSDARMPRIFRNIATLF